MLIPRLNLYPVPGRRQLVVGGTHITLTAANTPRHALAYRPTMPALMPPITVKRKPDTTPTR